jgi:hypothetical protein
MTHHSDNYVPDVFGEATGLEPRTEPNHPLVAEALLEVAAQGMGTEPSAFDYLVRMHKDERIVATMIRLIDSPKWKSKRCFAHGFVAKCLENAQRDGYQQLKEFMKPVRGVHSEPLVEMQVYPCPVCEVVTIATPIGKPRRVICRDCEDKQREPDSAEIERKMRMVEFAKRMVTEGKRRMKGNETTGT